MIAADIKTTPASKAEAAPDGWYELRGLLCPQRHGVLGLCLKAEQARTEERERAADAKEAEADAAQAKADEAFAALMRHLEGGADWSDVEPLLTAHDDAQARADALYADAEAIERGHESAEAERAAIAAAEAEVDASIGVESEHEATMNAIVAAAVAAQQERHADTSTHMRDQRLRQRLQKEAPRFNRWVWDKIAYWEAEVKRYRGSDHEHNRIIWDMLASLTQQAERLCDIWDRVSDPDAVLHPIIKAVEDEAFRPGLRDYLEVADAALSARRYQEIGADILFRYRQFVDDMAEHYRAQIAVVADEARRRDYAEALETFEAYRRSDDESIQNGRVIGLAERAHLRVRASVERGSWPTDEAGGMADNAEDITARLPTDPDTPDDRDPPQAEGADLPSPEPDESPALPAPETPDVGLLTHDPLTPLNVLPALEAEPVASLPPPEEEHHG